MNIFKKFFNKISWFLYDLNCKIFPAKKKEVGKFGRKKKILDTIFVYAVLIIPLIKFLGFWLYVNIEGLVMGFQNEKDGQIYWTLSNYATIFTQLIKGDGSVWEAYITTVKFQIYGIVLFPVGLFYMYFIFKKMAGYNFFRLMFYLPQIISAVVITGIYKYLINADGPIGILYQRLTGADRIPAFLAEKEYALTFVFIYQIWVGFAGSLLLYSGALARIPKELFEQACLDGVGWWRELWQICVPLIWPTLSIIIISFASGFLTMSGDILLLTEGRAGTTTLSYWLFDQIKFQNSYYLPSAMGWILTVVTFPLVMITRKICENVYKDVEF